MSLLNEIDSLTRLEPVSMYMEGIKDSGLDLSDPTIAANIIT